MTLIELILSWPLLGDLISHTLVVKALRLLGRVPLLIPILVMLLHRVLDLLLRFNELKALSVPHS